MGEIGTTSTSTKFDLYGGKPRHKTTSFIEPTKPINTAQRQSGDYVVKS